MPADPDQDFVVRWDGPADPVELLQREWLVTNGLGGYASASLSGAATRKYHGLFVPNLSSPKGRHVLISRCDELLVVGDQQFLLGGVEFANGELVGDAHRWLREFRFDRGIACWVYALGGVVLQKSIVMPHLQNTVCVRYELLQGKAAMLRIRPFVSFRRHDEVPSHEPQGLFTLSVQQGRHEVRVADNPMTLRMAIQPGPTVFTTQEQHDVEFIYRIDRDRGDVALDSAYSPGWFSAPLEAQQSACFIASSHPWEQLDFDASAVFEAERRRLDDLLRLSKVPESDRFAQRLVMASDQFVVLPGSRLEETVMAQAKGGELRSIYAGYHWFGDWGRDTMISLEGLTLCTGRYREAGAILRTFANYVKDGLLPNLFPEGERVALYHTVDATLWFFHAIARYVAVTGDQSIVRQLFPVLASIVEHHVRGTHFGIHMDPDDGLISAAAEGYQLTWMDAKVNGWVVTPRRGKPVEIQALWYNALRLMEKWASDLGHDGSSYAAVATQAHQAFNRKFWNDGSLLDVIEGPEGDDPALRPNQIFAVSLQHPVLVAHRWAAVVDSVQQHLLTPFGLRTLNREHSDYKSRYFGDLLARDAAYHQGTVWPWLIGHFIDAHLRVHVDHVAARTFLQKFPAHLTEAGIGSISEIFDAEPPHLPGGCIAQAWSVGEVLRAWLRTRHEASPSYMVDR
ncbi:amylo-alpha-1,6-glucosidase [Povalibacter sp.]|uniref:amylo-alpha-1,6-glucosidase n=1 Tax=Povalibacter sp. TaxID=1962978 RepID=UPI002F400B05